MILKNKKQILVVCHDAGGAEIVSAYVKRNVAKYNFFCIALGPAKKIFKRKRLANYFISKKEALKMLADKIDIILTSTSWASSLELDFIKAGKKKGIKTVAYLEHWKNYRERFGYPRKNWRVNLPDEIWVGDKYAFELAKKSFGKLPVKLMPNLYFKEIEEEYKKIKKNSKKIAEGILFLSEPISSQVNCFGDKRKQGLTEFNILEAILDFFSKRNFKNKVIIRFHPAEKKDKYDKILSKCKKLKIIKSNNKNILKDFVQARTVIGIDSMALVISCLCNKKTISFLPDLRKKCVLPLKEITKINKIKDLESII